MRERLLALFDHMAAHYGHTGWWPGDGPFEIAIGAILTQNTAWTNVERAIANLKTAGLLCPEAMLACSTGELEEVLRPSGYFRVKTDRVRNFCRRLVDGYDGRMEELARRPLGELRRELLGIKGVGPETADDILLYACGKPVFVVDAYTRRILARHGVVDPAIGYEPLRALFEENLEADVDLFKEFHGLIVWTGKDFCRKRPRCESCPLCPLLAEGQPLHV